ncbi:MAG TPA: Hsp20/alpha crystallin family protein [Actinomycetota bacterium]|nr:Hsp20/alpha crystallin family protein [Actinomycetota bacterium]
MAITRWDPFRDLMSIQNEMNRLFGRTYGGDVGETSRGAWTPSLDVYETQEKFVITMELPGVSPDDVDISVEDSTLVVRGERKFYREQDQDSFLRIERRFGEFTRSLTLPSTADAEGIQASFDQGVLMIEVPKREEARPRKITIKAKA